MRQNLPIILGLLGVWNSTFLGHETRAILPYAQALLRFPAHIQQVTTVSFYLTLAAGYGKQWKASRS